MKVLINTLIYEPLYNLLILAAWVIPGHSIGWAVVILTLIIRFALLPLSLKGAKAQARLQALQPRINELKKTIKDPMELNKATMELYKEEGVSPFGSCLPQLIQLPIIFVLYQVFRHGLDTSGYAALYSFIPRPEAINTMFFGLDLAQPERWVLPIAAAVTQYILSVMTMKPAAAATAGTDEPDPMQAAMKQMNFIFPAITFMWARSFPAAISVYWVVTTLFGIVQQWYVNEHVRKLPKKEQAKFLEEHDPSHFDPKKPLELEGKPVKKDLMTRMVSKRLDKEEKKAGVTVTIRKKQ